MIQSNWVTLTQKDSIPTIMPIKDLPIHLKDIYEKRKKDI